LLWAPVPAPFIYGRWACRVGSSLSEEPRANCSSATRPGRGESRADLVECFYRRPGAGGNVVGLEIALADLCFSRAHWPSLPHLRCNPIGYRIFPRPFSYGIRMEPARIPLLLRVVVIQHLRFPGRSSARPAAARCARYGKGRKIYSPLRPRPARIELGLRVDCAPSVVAAAIIGGKI
jgi:hypothetical protein